MKSLQQADLANGMNSARAQTAMVVASVYSDTAAGGISTRCIPQANDVSSQLVICDGGTH
jgi:hypothetical protein